MSYSSQQDAFPEGYPPKRARVEEPESMSSDLQSRLREISKKNLAECPEGTVAADYLKDDKKKR